MDIIYLSNFVNKKAIIEYHDLLNVSHLIEEVKESEEIEKIMTEVEDPLLKRLGYEKGD